MSENQTNAQQVSSNAEPVTSKVAKVIAVVGERLEAAVGELKDFQAKRLVQAKTFAETATRATHEQLAFAEQMGSEWRKLVLAATRTATAFFTPKA